MDIFIIFTTKEIQDAINKDFDKVAKRGLIFFFINFETGNFENLGSSVPIKGK